MTTKERGKNAGLGKSGKPARSDRAAQADAAREDEPLDEAGRTPDPRDGQDPCDEAPAAPDPAGAYERVLKDMTFAGASLEPNGLHPYDIAARGLRLILTAPEGSELANLREAFTPLAPLPFHVMVRAMELDWRERGKRLPPDSPAELRWFGELGSRGATIGQMVARLFMLLPCFEASPGSERGANPTRAPLDFLLYLLAVDVWRHPECLALGLPATPVPKKATGNLKKMEDDDHERRFFRTTRRSQTETSLGKTERIIRYRTKNPTVWHQFVQPQWWTAADRLRAWLLENLKVAGADSITLNALLLDDALEVLLTGLLERTFDDSTTKKEFAERVFGGIKPFSKVLDAVATKSVAKAERPSRGFREDIIQSEIIKQVPRESGDKVHVLGQRFCAGGQLEKLSAAKVWDRVCVVRPDLGWTSFNAFRQWFSGKPNEEAAGDRILKNVLSGFLRRKRSEEEA